MVTVPRWFESSMAHEAAVHHFLFWSFARYRFRKSAKCFFGTMGKNFEMILKSVFSVWLSKDDYYKSTSWHLCGPRLDRSVCRTLIQSSFLKIANTLPGAKPTRTNHIIIYGWNIKSWTRSWFIVGWLTSMASRGPWDGPKQPWWTEPRPTALDFKLKWLT